MNLDFINTIQWIVWIPYSPLWLYQMRELYQSLYHSKPKLRTVNSFSECFLTDTVMWHWHSTWRVWGESVCLGFWVTVHLCESECVCVLLNTAVRCNVTPLFRLLWQVPTHSHGLDETHTPKYPPPHTHCGYVEFLLCVCVCVKCPSSTSFLHYRNVLGRTADMSSYLTATGC